MKYNYIENFHSKNFFKRSICKAILQYEINFHQLIFIANALFSIKEAAKI